MIFGILGNDRQRVFRPQLGLHFIGHYGAAQTRTEDNNMSHDFLPFLWIRRFPHGGLARYRYNIIIL